MAWTTITSASDSTNAGLKGHALRICSTLRHDLSSSPFLLLRFPAWAGEFGDGASTGPDLGSSRPCNDFTNGNGFAPRFVSCKMRICLDRDLLCHSSYGAEVRCLALAAIWYRFVVQDGMKFVYHVH